MQEEIEAMRVENSQLRGQIRQVTREAESKKKEAKDEYHKNALEYQDVFRQQSKS